jgi:membrane protease YdiL (CAAX protease family)
MLFGLGHIYLGGSAMIKTVIGGLLFAAVALAAGSLWPAMVIHAATDLNSGDLGFRAFGGAAAQESAPSEPAAP